MQSNLIVIIGAGLSGIAAAVRLRSLGYHIIVLERNNTYGGKMAAFEWQGYRWDKGPSLFTLPEQVDELFLIAGKNPTDYYEYDAIDHSCHYFFNDGTDFLFKTDLAERNRDLIAFFGAIEGQKAIDYIEESKATYSSIGDLFIDHPKYTFRNILDKTLIQQYPKFLSRKLTGSLHSLNKRKFNDPRLIQIFDRFATYNGSNPYKTSGLYSMISHLELNKGVYFPKKGMRSIADSLYKLAIDLGVEFRFNQSQIKVIPRIEGGYLVSETEETLMADSVVSSIDIVNFYKYVLEDESASKKHAQRERSSSALVFYWAVEKAIPELKLHNLFFGGDYESEFASIFDDKKVPNAPSVYLHISSIINESDAPKGNQNWFLMVNMPAGIEVTDAEKEKIRNYIYQLILTKFNVNIEPHVKHESIWESADIETITGAYKGALYGASSNGKTAALKRHGNASNKYPGIYFCGGTVHPGGGIPLVLKSAKIVSELIQKNDD